MVTEIMSFLIVIDSTTVRAEIITLHLSKQDSKWRIYVKRIRFFPI